MLKAVLSAEKLIAAHEVGWTDFKFNDYMEVGCFIVEHYPHGPLQVRGEYSSGHVIVVALNEEMLPTSYVPPEPPAE